MCRTPLLAAALLVAGSCGGSPTAPASTLPPARPVVLNSGPYVLAITLATVGTTPPSICGDNPVDTTASFNVDLERSGSAATVRVPGTASLTLSLVVSATSVTGTISGSARDAGGVSIGASGTVSGIAPSDPAIAVSGNIDGTVSIPGGFCFNNSHRWSLSPR